MIFRTYLESFLKNLSQLPTSQDLTEVLQSPLFSNSGDTFNSFLTDILQVSQLLKIKNTPEIHKLFVDFIIEIASSEELRQFFKELCINVCDWLDPTSRICAEMSDEELKQVSIWHEGRYNNCYINGSFFRTALLIFCLESAIPSFFTIDPDRFNKKMWGNYFESCTNPLLQQLEQHQKFQAKPLSLSERLQHIPLADRSLEDEDDVIFLQENESECVAPEALERLIVIGGLIACHGIAIFSKKSMHSYFLHVSSNQVKDVWLDHDSSQFHNSLENNFKDFTARIPEHDFLSIVVADKRGYSANFLQKITKILKEKKINYKVIKVSQAKLNEFSESDSNRWYFVCDRFENKFYAVCGKRIVSLGNLKELLQTANPTKTNKILHQQLIKLGVFSNTEKRKESYRAACCLSREEYRKMSI